MRRQSCHTSPSNRAAGRGRHDPEAGLLDAARQQDTIRRIWKRLLDKHDAQVSYCTVHADVARRRSKMAQID